MDQDLEAEFVGWVGSRYAQFVRTAWLICGDESAAEDLVQDALIKIAKKWERVRDGHPEAYLRQILVRDTISSRRRRSAVPGAEPAGARLMGATASAADPAVQVGQRVDVARALAALAPRQRAVLVLRFYDDLSEAQTADVLGISVGTVKSQTHHALARLREVPGLLPPSTMEARS